MATATTTPEPTTAQLSSLIGVAPDPVDPLYRISLELYNRMIELGLLGPATPSNCSTGFW